jgi:hypothetical protein
VTMQEAKAKCEKIVDWLTRASNDLRLIYRTSPTHDPIGVLQAAAECERAASWLLVSLHLWERATELGNGNAKK